MVNHTHRHSSKKKGGARGKETTRDNKRTNNTMVFGDNVRARKAARALPRTPHTKKKRKKEKKEENKEDKQRELHAPVTPALLPNTNHHRYSTTT